MRLAKLFFQALAVCYVARNNSSSLELSALVKYPTVHRFQRPPIAPLVLTPIFGATPRHFASGQFRMTSKRPAQWMAAVTLFSAPTPRFPSRPRWKRIPDRSGVSRGGKRDNCVERIPSVEVAPRSLTLGFQFGSYRATPWRGVAVTGCRGCLGRKRTLGFSRLMPKVPNPSNHHCHLMFIGSLNHFLIPD